MLTGRLVNLGCHLNWTTKRNLWMCPKIFQGRINWGGKTLIVHQRQKYFPSMALYKEVWGKSFCFFFFLPASLSWWALLPFCSDIHPWHQKQASPTFQCVPKTSCSWGISQAFLACLRMPRHPSLCPKLLLGFQHLQHADGHSWTLEPNRVSQPNKPPLQHILIPAALLHLRAQTNAVHI